MPEASGLVALSHVPIEALLAYDRPFFPANRASFIKSWVMQPDSHAMGIQCDGKLAGYGVIRRGRSGHKIGPLYADRSELAELLLLALKAKVDASEAVYLDTPEVNRYAVDLAERCGMKMVFETARMYTGAFPDLPINRLFGVTSFEVG